MNNPTTSITNPTTPAVTGNRLFDFVADVADYLEGVQSVPESTDIYPLTFFLVLFLLSTNVYLYVKVGIISKVSATEVETLTNEIVQKIEDKKRDRNIASRIKARDELNEKLKIPNKSDSL